MPALKDARHELFTQNVLRGMSDTDAHDKAGFARSGQNAGRLRRRPDVGARIAELTASAIAKTLTAVTDKINAQAMADASVERVVQEMVRLAFYDMTEILQVKGDLITMRDPTSLPEDLRRAIVSITPVKVGKGMQYECKFADKQRAIDSLARHLQMFKDTVVVENVFRIVSEMNDDELTRRLDELERALREAATLDTSAGAGPAGLN